MIAYKEFENGKRLLVPIDRLGDAINIGLNYFSSMVVEFKKDGRSMPSVRLLSDYATHTTVLSET